MITTDIALLFIGTKGLVTAVTRSGKALKLGRATAEEGKYITDKLGRIICTDAKVVESTIIVEDEVKAIEAIEKLKIMQQAKKSSIIVAPMLEAGNIGNTSITSSNENKDVSEIIKTYEIPDAQNLKMSDRDNSSSTVQKIGKTNKEESAKGLIGKDFEDYLTRKLGGSGSFHIGGREFDGKVGNRWWEAKSGQYWDMLSSNQYELLKFQSDMGARLAIAKNNGATYELFSNTPIPSLIKQWLTNKGIKFTEILI